MELRHLRCFLAVSEELHFALAAEKLHMEQSPLSRTIKELEEDMGEQLFVRTSRSTRLTRAGKLFLEHVPRVFAALQQARDSVKAAANGFDGQSRIALSEGITPSRLPALLALCRQEEPEVDVRLFQVPLSQQIKELHDDLYDVGFAQSDEVGEGVAAEAVWGDPLMVAVPARHHLLKYRRIPLDEVLLTSQTTAAVPCVANANSVARPISAAPPLIRPTFPVQQQYQSCSLFRWCCYGETVSLSAVARRKRGPETLPLPLLQTSSPALNRELNRGV